MSAAAAGATGGGGGMARTDRGGGAGAEVLPGRGRAVEVVRPSGSSPPRPPPAGIWAARGRENCIKSYFPNHDRARLEGDSLRRGVSLATETSVLHTRTVS